jgi:hypothetical protein
MACTVCCNAACSSSTTPDGINEPRTRRRSPGSGPAFVPQGAPTGTAGTPAASPASSHRDRAAHAPSVGFALAPSTGAHERYIPDMGPVSDLAEAPATPDSLAGAPTAALPPDAILPSAVPAGAHAGNGCVDCVGGDFGAAAPAGAYGEVGALPPMAPAFPTQLNRPPVATHPSEGSDASYVGRGADADAAAAHPGEGSDGSYEGMGADAAPSPGLIATSSQREA